MQTGETPLAEFSQGLGPQEAMVPRVGIRLLIVSLIVLSAASAFRLPEILKASSKGNDTKGERSALHPTGALPGLSQLSTCGRFHALS